MKKVSLAATLLFLMFCFLAHPVSAKTYQEKGYEYYLEDKEAVIQKVPSVKGNIQIPETLGGFKVTKIAGYAFSRNICESVSIPDSITEIQGGAFYKCSKLKSVKLPSKLDKISYYLFEDCVSLENVTLGSSIHEIQSGAFYNCVKLNKIDLPNSVKKIRGYAFYKCFKLSKINLGNKLTEIGTKAFYKNYALKKVVIPASVKKVEEEAFAKCDDLLSVKFNGTGTKLGDSIFRNCTSLRKVSLPGKMKYIPEKLFYGCEKLNKLTLPKQVSFIKASSFRGCKALKSIHLTKKVYAIGDSAFRESGLKSIKLNKHVQFIGNSAFASTGIRNLNMGENVLYIGNNVFADCSRLRKIYIPANVKGINSNAFNNCSSLRSIRVSSANKHYSAKNGVLYNKDMTKLIQYPLHKTNRTFRVPASVTYIRSDSFNGNNYLRELTTSAAKIGSHAFQQMGNLRTVHINKGTQKIGSYAFQACNKLTRADIADSVKNIGDYAFSETKIREAHIPSQLKVMNESVFYRCNHLSAFTGGHGKKFSVKDGVLYNGSMTKLIQYPSKKKAKTFNVPRSVKKVSYDAFYRVTNLTKLYFEKGIQKLPYGCISRLNNLKSIVFASGTKLKNAQSAVNDCPKLAVIVGPNGYQIRWMAYNAHATLITL